MGGYASGRLTLHACDLEREGAFDEVFVGCNGVVHTGAQLGRKNPQEHRAGQYVGTTLLSKRCQRPRQDCVAHL
jgi:nucleoside-diphosphate-sugar epimerase